MVYQASSVQGQADCVNATVTLGAEAGDTIPITIQLLDAAGRDLDYVEEVSIAIFANVGRTAYATSGGSTGIEIGTDGAVQAIVANKYFKATCEIDGDIDLTWTDTAHEVAFLGLKLPNGKWVMSAALTTAA